MAKAGQIRAGIGGWTFEPWRGVFYPQGLKHADELAYASRRLNTLEINSTYYSSQKPETFAKWAAATPDGFEVSRIDLEVRDEGDVLGAGQSGRRSGLHMLSVLKHGDVVAAARHRPRQAVDVRSDAADDERRILPRQHQDTHPGDGSPSRSDGSPRRMTPNGVRRRRRC